MTKNDKHPFQDPTLALEKRVANLVEQLTLDEKINQMCQYQDEIPRLGIKAYKHGTEAAHGMAWLGEATSFPQPIGLACTWDTELLKRIGDVIGDEARGFYKRNPAINGLTLWAPTVDMERDPRWGRTEEAYGEDPHLTGKLASALIHGLQGDHPFYLKAVASLKHFIGNNNEIERGECSVSIDPRNMREYYLKAFEIPFKEGKAQSMMTAYNSVNGVPANFNPDVNQIVKQEWGMDGFVVSDAGDVLGTVNDHHYVDTYKEALAGTIKAGVDSITDDHEISKQAIRDALADGLLSESDLDTALTNTFRVRMRLGEFDPDEMNPYASIDESIILNPEHIALSLEAVRKSIVLLKNDHHTLPLQASKIKKIAVIGPLGDTVYRDWYSGTLPYAVTPLEGIKQKLTGNDHQIRFASGNDQVTLKSVKTGQYVSLDQEKRKALVANQSEISNAEIFELSDWGWDSHTLISQTNGRYLTTDDTQVTASAEHIWEWFTKEVFHIRSASDLTEQVKMTTWNDRPISVNPSTGAIEVKDGIAADAEPFAVHKVTDGLSDAIAAAHEADTAVVFVGNHPLINGKETIDRPDLTLAEAQENLIKQIYAVNPNTIVVIVGSYPFAIDWVNAHVPAIIYSSHAGHELGTALADVLFGQHNPSARLNMTWYESVKQLGKFMDYDIRKSGRTYQYFEGKPLYSFGHGLSYTSFEYSDIELDCDRVSEGGQVKVSCIVKNVGESSGEEVVQLYTQAIESRVKRPLKQLQGFKKVAIEKGKSAVVTFELAADELVFWDVTRERFCLESGQVKLMLGASSSDIRLSSQIMIEGETIPPRDLSQLTKAVNYDDYEGVLIGENTEGRDSVVVSEPLSWVRYEDVVMTADLKSFQVRVLGKPGAQIQIRLDHPEGKLIGSCELVEDAEQWQTLTCSIDTVSERNYSVYLILNGELRLSWFQFGQ